MILKIKHIYSLINRNMSHISKTTIVNGIGCEKFIKVEENDEKKTANVVMQRLPVNGFNLELLQELTNAIKDLERRNFKGIILSSSLPTIFSAGLDLTEFFEPDETRLRTFWKQLQNLWKTLYVTPLITIAAINGHAPAGGCLLAMSCDHSIMVKNNSTIGLPAAKVGIIAPKWLCTMYINALGFRKAEHAVKSAELFSPEEALNLSIVDELVECGEELMPRAEKRLHEWLQIPSASFLRSKLSLRQPYVDDFISYADEEVNEVVNVILQAETQTTLRNYFASLKNREKV